MKKYFRGWYFKCSNDTDTIAFIPAIHSDGRKESASLQVVTKEGAYIIDYNEICYERPNLKVVIGKSVFSSDGIKINIKSKDVTAYGELEFRDINKIKYDIMGPFKFVPKMECRHSVFSMSHIINGKLVVNGKRYIFNNGIGYIEGDRGCSFPKSYAWTQCHFNEGSLMLSVADIPFMGSCFSGVIGVIKIKDKEYRLATYLGAKMNYIGDGKIVVSQGGYLLVIKLLDKSIKRKGIQMLELNAPNMGGMTRKIKEGIECKAKYRFSYNGDKLLELVSDKASFEYEY